MVTTRYRLAGLADDYAGSDQTLTRLRPVLEDPPHLLVPSIDEWTRADLAILTRRESEYFYPTEWAPFVSEGDWVWLAGPAFMASLSLVPELETFFEQIDTSWKRFEADYCFKVGQISEFDEYSESIYRLAKRAMLRDLFLPDSDHSIADAAFRILDNLANVETRDQFLTSGLYLWATHDEDRFAILAESAILSAAFETIEGFRNDVRQARVWHEESIAESRDAAATQPRESPSRGLFLVPGVAIAADENSTLNDLFKSVSVPGE